MQKHKVTAYLDADVARDLAALAARRRVPATRIVEAALTRRLDRLTRRMERLERDQQITGEALAVFIRVWLTTTPPMPDDLREAAQAKGRERYGSFVETLARRLAKGTTLSRELTRDVAAAEGGPEEGGVGGR
jgi:hypothetical protein